MLNLTDLIIGAPNFTLGELVRSTTAISKGLDNTPTDPVVINNLYILAREALQKGRNALGVHIVNSAYRSPVVNKAVGGSPSSWHCKGCAADITVRGKSLWEVFTWYYENIPCVELIAEELPSGWIHVAFFKDMQPHPAITKYKLSGQSVRRASYQKIQEIFEKQGLI